MAELPTREALLERAALRVAGNERMFGSALRDWCGGQLDLAAVAAHLACAREVVVQLALCSRPAPNEPTFQQDLNRIGAAIGIEPVRLLVLLREVASISAFRRSNGSQLLAAARDEREPDDPGEK